MTIIGNIGKTINTIIADKKYNNDVLAIIPYINNGTTKKIHSIKYVITITLINFAIKSSTGFIGSGNIFSKSFEK